MRNFIVYTILLLSAVSFTGCTKESNELFPGDYSYADISEVELTGGSFLDAMLRTRDYLYSLDPDKFLHYFRLNAGLDTISTHYGGWEERELRGHSLGHYLSACSQMFAATGDTVLKNKTAYIVESLAKCQEETGTGYLSAFPEEFIDRVENTEDVWAPYYTLHKIMAGLYDCYRYTGNSLALEVLTAKSDWLYGRCSELSYDQMQSVLDHTEQGGMNEVLFNLYSVNGESRYLELGRMFYQDSYFSPILSYYDSLKGEHVNSFIPNVTGLMREYELTGDPDKYRIADWFWNQVVTARSYITGGTSNGEHWNADPYHMDEELGPASHETCCTYNMLKLTKHMFRESPEPKYMDYYERALLNGILPTQHPETNMTMYYVPMQSGYFKTFSTAENSFWCCTGSGMENFARSGESIYMTGKNKLFVNLYIPSVLALEEQGLVLEQQTSFPDDGKVKFILKTRDPSDFALSLRIPVWTTKDFSVMVNGKDIDCSTNPGSYLNIDRKWKTGDEVMVYFPMKLNMVSLPAKHELFALMHGPLVLAAELPGEDPGNDKVYGHYGPYDTEPLENIPAVKVGSIDEPRESFTAQGDHNFVAAGTGGEEISFVPFYKLFGKRYMIYFNVNNLP
ncbi:MAG: glycoside hydrolase family 127 protein [Bacteroidales bacterium]|nr:glycoside hydrolase family 127 protein [Bacteroidales bacterium]